MFALALGKKAAARPAAPEKKDLSSELDRLADDVQRQTYSGGRGADWYLQGINDYVAHVANEAIANLQDYNDQIVAEMQAASDPTLADAGGYADVINTLARVRGAFVDLLAVAGKSARPAPERKDMPFAAIGTPDADDRAEPYVGEVTVSSPQLRRFRATLVRNVCQTAIVEFPAMEGENAGALAEEVAEQVPAESWTTRDGGSYFYFDKIEDAGPASLLGASGADVRAEHGFADDAPAPAKSIASPQHKSVVFTALATMAAGAGLGILVAEAMDGFYGIRTWTSNRYDDVVEQLESFKDWLADAKAELQGSDDPADQQKLRQVEQAEAEADTARQMLDNPGAFSDDDTA